MIMMMMIKVSDVGHKLPGLNPAPDIAFLPHPVLLYNAALHFTILLLVGLYNTRSVELYNAALHFTIGHGELTRVNKKHLVTLFPRGKI
jgi:hypothetical protein